MRFLYLFTEFPAPTETFYQREVRALRDAGADFELWSLWRGADEFEGLRVHRFAKWRLALVPFALTAWTLRRPRAVANFFAQLFRRRPPDAENFGQTLLGAAFAVLHADRLDRAGFARTHAAWANMPATAALCLRELTGLPFSMGAHAYDLYRNGGDWLLGWKLATADAVTTSSLAARETLLERGAKPAHVHLVRRGLTRFPTCRPPRERAADDEFRVLSVGRLVAKKGYPVQLAAYAALSERPVGSGLLPDGPRDGSTRRTCDDARMAPSEVLLRVRIAGDGPLRASLVERADHQGIADRVEFLGGVPFEQVEALYAWADALVFSGEVARDGNRDGLPNVIGEAMAAGVPVIASDVSAVSEAVSDGETGLLVPPGDSAALAAALRRLANNTELYAYLRENARAWAEANYDANRSAKQLITLLASLPRHGGGKR